MSSSEPLKIDVGAAGVVSALWSKPSNALACLVFAHGASAGMAHPFMEAVAAGLLERNIATLRYQFPYMEQRNGRPDAPARAHMTVRAAVEQAGSLAPGCPFSPAENPSAGA
jgi:uncharacterized protein